MASLSRFGYRLTAFAQLSAHEGENFRPYVPGVEYIELDPVFSRLQQALVLKEGYAKLQIQLQGKTTSYTLGRVYHAGDKFYVATRQTPQYRSALAKADKHTLAADGYRKSQALSKLYQLAELELGDSELISVLEELHWAAQVRQLQGLYPEWKPVDAVVDVYSLKLTKLKLDKPKAKSKAETKPKAEDKAKNKSTDKAKAKVTGQAKTTDQAKATDQAQADKLTAPADDKVPAKAQANPQAHAKAKADQANSTPASPTKLETKSEAKSAPASQASLATPVKANVKAQAQAALQAKVQAKTQAKQAQAKASEVQAQELADAKAQIAALKQELEQALTKAAVEASEAEVSAMAARQVKAELAKLEQEHANLKAAQSQASVELLNTQAQLAQAKAKLAQDQADQAQDQFSKQELQAQLAAATKDKQALHADLTKTRQQLSQLVESKAKAFDEVAKLRKDLAQANQQLSQQQEQACAAKQIDAAVAQAKQEAQAKLESLKQELSQAKQAQSQLNTEVAAAKQELHQLEQAYQLALEQEQTAKKQEVQAKVELAQVKKHLAQVKFELIQQKQEANKARTDFITVKADLVQTRQDLAKVTSDLRLTKQEQAKKEKLAKHHNKQSANSQGDNSGNHAAPSNPVLASASADGLAANLAQAQQDLERVAKELEAATEELASLKAEQKRIAEENQLAQNQLAQNQQAKNQLAKNQQAAQAKAWLAAKPADQNPSAQSAQVKPAEQASANTAAIPASGKQAGVATGEQVAPTAQAQPAKVKQNQPKPAQLQPDAEVFEPVVLVDETTPLELVEPLVVVPSPAVTFLTPANARPAHEPFVGFVSSGRRFVKSTKATVGAEVGALAAKTKNQLDFELYKPTEQELDTSLLYPLTFAYDLELIDKFIISRIEGSKANISFRHIYNEAKYIITTLNLEVPKPAGLSPEQVEAQAQDFIALVTKSKHEPQVAKAEFFTRIEGFIRSQPNCVGDLLEAHATEKWQQVIGFANDFFDQGGEGFREAVLTALDRLREQMLNCLNESYFSQREVELKRVPTKYIQDGRKHKLPKLYTNVDGFHFSVQGDDAYHEKMVAFANNEHRDFLRRETAKFLQEFRFYLAMNRVILVWLFNNIVKILLAAPEQRESIASKIQFDMARPTVKKIISIVFEPDFTGAQAYKDALRAYKNQLLFFTDCEPSQALLDLSAQRANQVKADVPLVIKVDDSKLAWKNRKRRK